MSIRQKGYADYNLCKEEAEALIKRCRKLDRTESALLWECADKANKAAAEAVYYGLTHGLSYEKLSIEVYPRYSKGDYYAYRRKTIALFRDALVGGGFYDKRRTGAADSTGN